jgi:hypothetical protein
MKKYQLIYHMILIDLRHRYYKMFEGKDNCEINFRLFYTFALLKCVVTVAFVTDKPRQSRRFKCAKV